MNWRAYPYTSLRCLCVRVTDACHAIGFLVEEHYVGDVAQFGAFFADVLLDIEDSGGILLDAHW